MLVYAKKLEGSKYSEVYCNSFAEAYAHDCARRIQVRFWIRWQQAFCSADVTYILLKNEKNTADLLERTRKDEAWLQLL